MKFRNDLEKAVYEIAKNVCAKADVEHNRVIEIETADSPEVASFSGPPKKEIDVITAIFSERVQMLISCKKHKARAQPVDVQEWAAVVQTMNRYSGGTEFVGLIVSPSGFTAGCEPWATSHNLGLIPPLKGKDFSFTEASAVQMSRRVLGAFAKRMAFSRAGLFTPPGFYDFVFGLTVDFEGRDEEAAGRRGGRYSLLETGWMSSFGELVSTAKGAQIKDVIATSECLGLELSDGLLFLYFGDRIVFGSGAGFEPPGHPIEPQCRKNLDDATYSFSELRRLVTGQKIVSAGDFGTHFEFGLGNDVNLGFYPNFLHVLRTLNPPEEHLL